MGQMQYKCDFKSESEMSVRFDKHFNKSIGRKISGKR